MSVVPTGLAGSAAGTAVAHQVGQQMGQVESSAAEARRATAAQRAAEASGVAHTQEESAPYERDADGRRPWEPPANRPHDDETARSELSPTDERPQSRDPSGTTGSLLDLRG